ncbi:MAG: hypothetical protein K6C33_07695 [Desulfovibrio sp.]|nr:hypothetical protein [Desulfovibrio sp.]
MLKLLKGIFKGFLWLLLACLLLGGLALLAWWAGWPMITVLAAPMLLAAGVVLLWGLRRLWLWGRRRLYVQTVLAEDPARRQAAEEQDTALSRAWRRGMQVFSRSRLLDGSQLAGRNPWALLFGGGIGADWGAVHAGQAAQPEPNAPLGWHFLQDLVLLEPSSGMLEARTPEQRAMWEEFLANLSQARSREPVNGFAVCIDAGLLQAGHPMQADALRRLALLYRSRIEDVLAVVPARAPVRVAVTGIERLPGGACLLRRLSPDSRQVMLGAQFAVPEATLVRQGAVDTAAQAHLATACAADSLRALIFDEASHDKGPRGGEFAMPASLSQLEAGLALFLETLFRPGPLDAAPFLRAIHFACTGAAPGADQPLLKTSVQKASRPAEPAPAAPPARATGAGAATAAEAGAGMPAAMGLAPAATAAPQQAAPVSAAAAGDSPAEAVPPCFTQRLLAGMAQDRGLARPCSQPRPKDGPWAAVYAGACLALIAGCVIFASSAIYNHQVLTEASSRLEDAAKAGAPKAAAEDACARLLEKASGRWWLPSFGLSRLQDALALHSAAFTAEMQTSVLPGVLNGISREAAETAKPAGTPGAGFPYADLQRALWLKECLDKRQKGDESYTPFPVDQGTQHALNAQGQALWNTDFAALYLDYLHFASEDQLRRLGQELDWRTQALAGGGQETFFNRLVELVNARTPQWDVPLSRFWPNVPRGSRRFASVPPAYTAQGYAEIAGGLERLAQDTDAPAAASFRDSAWWKMYLERYASVWADFVMKSDDAWRKAERLDELKRMDAGSGGRQAPQMKLLAELAVQLAPLRQEKNLPAWGEEIFLLDAVSRIAEATQATKDKDKKGVIEIAWNSRDLPKDELSALKALFATPSRAKDLARAVDALAAYEGALAELGATALNPDGAMELASIEFGGKDYGDPKATAPAKASDALTELFQALGTAGASGGARGRGGVASTPGRQLMLGRIQLGCQTALYTAALQLQAAWDSQVLPQADLLPEDAGTEPFFGKDGIVTKFAEGPAKPFLTREVGSFKAKSKNGMAFPFTKAFLACLQKGQAAGAKPAKDKYETTVATRTADVNPESAERLQFYDISLACKGGPQSVRNSNYPADAVFSYEPASCQGVELHMSFPTLDLAYSYSDFNAFLEAFRAGERKFTADDFPNQKEAFDRLRLDWVLLRVLVDQSDDILEAFTGEIQIPDRISEVW